MSKDDSLRPAVLLASILLGSCTILSSAGGKLPADGGSAYALPKAVLEVTLLDTGGNLTITVGQPEYVADERYTYLLRYVPSALSSDIVELTIDPKTDLLQTVSATADDKTSATIIALAKAAAMIAQANAAEVVLLKRKIDPSVEGEVAQLEADMNKVAQGHARRQYVVQECATKPKDGACVGYASIIGGTTIQFKVAAPQKLIAEAADCSIGICYRAAAPYGITFSFNEEYSFNTVVNLPNDRPAIVLPMERTSFVKRIDSAEFENGMLKKTHIEKPSEALEVASLPVNVMTAIFESISTFLQAKIELSGKEKALADARKEQLMSEQALAKERREMEAQAAVASAGAFLLTGSSNGSTLNQKIPSIVVPGTSAAPEGNTNPNPNPNPNPSGGVGMFDPGSPGTNQ